MKFLLYIVIGIIFFFFIRRILNWGGCLGLILGIIIGSSLGVAGGGGADNGVFIFGLIGLIIVGLIYKRTE